MANSVDEHGFLKGLVIDETGLETILATSNTKLLAMRHLLKLWKLDGDVKVVYYGDSLTDLECLFDPAVKGVVVGDHGSTSLLRALVAQKTPPLVETYTPDFETNALVELPGRAAQKVDGPEG